MSQVEAATNDDVWPELKHDNLAHRGKSNGERERERDDIWRWAFCLSMCGHFGVVLNHSSARSIREQNLGL